MSSDNVSYIMTDQSEDGLLMAFWEDTDSVQMAGRARIRLLRR